MDGSKSLRLRHWLEYKTWGSLKSRCYNEKNPSYAHYGGAGVRVCKAWHDSFAAFLNDMGPRPAKGYSIDRINVHGDYEPGNCRWATIKEQNNNHKYQNRIEWGGEVLTVAQWAERLQEDPQCLYARKRRGWPVENVLFGDYKRPPNAKVSDSRRQDVLLAICAGHTKLPQLYEIFLGVHEECVKKEVRRLSADGLISITPVKGVGRGKTLACVPLI